MPCNIHYDEVSEVPNFFPNQFPTTRDQHLALRGLGGLPFKGLCTQRKDALLHIVRILGTYLRPCPEQDHGVSDRIGSLDPFCTQNLATIMHLFMQRQYEYNLCVRAACGAQTAEMLFRSWAIAMNETMDDFQETARLILKYIWPTKDVYPDEVDFLAAYERHQVDRSQLFSDFEKVVRRFRRIWGTGSIWIKRKELNSLEMQIVNKLAPFREGRRMEVIREAVFLSYEFPIILCGRRFKPSYTGDVEREKATIPLDSLLAEQDLEDLLCNTFSFGSELTSEILHSYGTIMGMENIFRNNMGIILQESLWNDIYNEWPDYTGHGMLEDDPSPRDTR